MKTQLDFVLDPRRFFNVWMLFYVLVLLPYAYYNITFRTGIEDMQQASTGVWLFLGSLAGGMVMFFFLGRMFIEHVRVGDRQLEFQGEFWDYLGRAVSGFLLSMLTMALYMAWFLRDIFRFFVSNSHLDGEYFQFMGNVHRLFIILVLSLFLPIILLSLLTLRIPQEVFEAPWYFLAQQAVSMLVMIPYMYFLYEWMMDIRYREYEIYWDTHYGEALPLIFREMILGILSLGIYMPMAWLKLYHFFAGRTMVAKEGAFRRFEFELDAREDFVFLWKQILMFVLTLGLYGPWAITRIGKHILSKTYLLPEEEVPAA